MKKPLALISLMLLLIFSLAAQNANSIKLFRFGELDDEKPAVITEDGRMLDVSAFGEDYDELFFSNNGIVRLKEWFEKNQSNCPAVPTNSRIASCVSKPSKIVAIGLNYMEHIKEGPGDGNIPSEPVIFLKATTSLSGPYDDVLIPKNAQMTDYEVELAVIIGKKATYVSEDEALDYIAGFAIINDYSEREWQLQKDGGQWDKGKSSDTFAPIGPFLVLAEEIDNPRNLNIWLNVNGETRQLANTGDMIFHLAEIISYTSHYMTLLPGDVIATGTPSGVGLGQKPPTFLKVGDVVELGIDQLGTQKQVVGSYVKNYLTAEEYEDYKNWVSLGVGGLPHTLEGFRTVKNLGKNMGNTLDVGRITPLIGTNADKAFLKKLPKRIGKKPNIAPFAIPHRQIDQLNDDNIRKIQQNIFDAAIAENAANLKYDLSGFERHNKAIFLKDSLSGNPLIMESTKGEIGHIHPSDGTMHFCYLSPSDAKVVIESGWGEFHGLAGDGRLSPTYLMVYSPRDEKELEITKEILEAAINFALDKP